jgi:hypothetical protein
LLHVLMSQRGGSLSRDQIIGTFWPESDSARSRNALRQALSFLRRCLGHPVVVSVGSHGVAVSDAITCDAVQFEALLDANSKEEALSLYGGELLPGFHAEEEVHDPCDGPGIPVHQAVGTDGECLINLRAWTPLVRAHTIPARDQCARRTRHDCCACARAWWGAGNAASGAN